MGKKKSVILVVTVLLVMAAVAAALLLLGQGRGQDREQAAGISSEKDSGAEEASGAGQAGEGSSEPGSKGPDKAGDNEAGQAGGSGKEKASGTGQPGKPEQGKEKSDQEQEAPGAEARPDQEQEASGAEARPDQEQEASGAEVKPAGGVSDYGALQVIGSSLCDSRGNPVQLKGVSTHGLAWFPEYVNEELFRELREEWKANVVRLAMYTGESGGYCTGGDRERLRQLIRDGVKYASDQDMYVIIDWHILSDGDPNTYKEDAENFFREMSAEFADQDNVLYEICNEPNGGTSWSRIKEYAGEIIPVIRENDEDAVILVGTPNWSQYVEQAAADPVTDWDNIMYTLHFYAATHKESLRQAMTAALDGGLPIFVSEYSICDASGNGGIDEAQAEAWVETMDRYGVSYVAWNLSNKNETSSLFSASCTKTSGFTGDELSSTGKWLYGILAGGRDAGAADQESRGDRDQESQGRIREDRNQEDSGRDRRDRENDGRIDSGVGQMFRDNQGQGNQSQRDPNRGNQDQESQARESAGQTGTEQPDREQTGSGQAGGVTATAGEGLAAEVTLVNSWESNGSFFYQLEVTVENISGAAIEGWSVDVTFHGTPELSDSWNGVYTAEGNILHISSVDYNGKLDSGASAENIGFIVSGGADLLP